MTTAVIVDAVRTPGGRRNGKLRGWHAVDLAAEPLKALAERNDLDPALVDDVIMGCVMQVGEQALNIGRNAVLAAGYPESVPSTTIDRQCGSSQQALHFAAQGVMAGAYDVVAGDDYDCGAPPILKSHPEGRALLIAAQKSGMVYALDPDQQGAIVWQRRIATGGPLGGLGTGAEQPTIAASAPPR